MGEMSTILPPADPLIGGLLVRKGEAVPAQRHDADLKEAHAPRRRRIILDAARVHENNPPSPDPDVCDSSDNDIDAEDSARFIKTSTEWSQRYAQERKESLKLAKSKERVSYTVRLDAERHAKLRFIAAYEQRPAQHVMLDALERYLSAVVPFVINEHVKVKDQQ